MIFIGTPFLLILTYSSELWFYSANQAENKGKIETFLGMAMMLTVQLITPDGEKIFSPV